ncbi:MAG: HAD family hydrolase [Pseudomonadota bacterium]
MSGAIQALVFDFDGVLADSVEVKTEAFRAMYAPHGDRVTDEVVAFHRANGGMPRREKFRHYQTALLGSPPTEAQLDALGERFSALVLDRVVAAPEIPGARTFLERWHGVVPLFVNSATPDQELRDILARRGMAHFFEAALGSGRSKTDNLTAILGDYRLDPKQVVFFGDAASDHRAAQACGTPFVGIDRHATGLLRASGVEADIFSDFESATRDSRFNPANRQQDRVKS